MSSRQPGDVKEYYRRITETDIADVAGEILAGRITGKAARSLLCDCPHHKSQSHRSLNIMLDRQGWFCFGCGVGGDVLQLVEFVQSSHVTRDRCGTMTESHRAARDFLAERAGLPPLGEYGLSPAQLAAMESSRAEELRVQETLTALAELYHRRLKCSPEILEWFQARYRIGNAIIDDLRIGYAANGPWRPQGGEDLPGVITTLTQAPFDFSLRDLAASGAFRPDSQDGLNPFFDGRIVFPYWSRGHVVFLIGRKTPWTPNQPWEQGKYKKLPVPSEENGYISPHVKNDHLFNEDCFFARPDRIVITEGVTDCISLMERRFPAVSPVTVQIKQADWDRLVPKAAAVKTVYICQDNEFSEAGLNGALRTARLLAARGVRTKVALLPLEQKQVTARAQLKERFGLTSGVGPRELAKRLEGRPEAELKEAERLYAEAKTDVNEFFAAGHTKEDFELILASAESPLELAIASLPNGIPEAARNHLLGPILSEVALLTPLEQVRHMKLIQSRCGNDAPSTGVLRDQIKVLQKADRNKKREGGLGQAQSKSKAESGSCRAIIDDLLQQMEAAGEPPDFSRVAEAALSWLVSNGGRFFRTSQGEPFLFFQDEILWMDSSDRGRRRLYLSKMYCQTGIVATTPGGRTFYEVLANLAVTRGEQRDQLSWIHTDVTKYAVYFNLNNEKNEIVRISPHGVDILKNGGNADGVILTPSSKTAPIHFLADVDPDEADRILLDLIIGNLTCPPGDRFLIVSWLSCFLLIDFTGTRPMARFEGPTSSGKTTASKLITTLVYGKEQQKKSTDAANYTDGAHNPLIALDNIEVKQMTDELVNFILTTVTGIVKEKRKGGTDTETVLEQPKCLLNTSGIEPLGGELAEVLSRTFIVRFDQAAANDCFLEAQLLARIRDGRDLILSALIKRTSSVLHMLRDGAHEKVMRLLHHALGNHNKRRCNDYLSLMYLMMLAGGDPDEIERGLEELNPRFLERIVSLNTITQETARESNQIATVLATLFNAYRHARDADNESTSMYVGKSNKAAFLERYHLKFEDEKTIKGAAARDLYIALKRLAKDFGLAFPINSVQQFAQRFSNDLPTIRQVGFEVTVTELAQRFRTYDIVRDG